MPRPRKNPITSASSGSGSSTFSSWAESLGEALGRGVARGINAGLSNVTLGGGAAAAAPASSAATGARRRGRPPKAQAGGPVAPDRMCKVPGCGREARSKGLCSAHYQAERRRLLGKAGGKS